MLGVFGNIPAFDTNFRKGFRTATLCPKADHAATRRQLRDRIRLFSVPVKGVAEAGAVGFGACNSVVIISNIA
jgi:hypothetical protein